MCGRCANLENRLSHERIKRIRATDRYRGSREHREEMKRLKEVFRGEEAKNQSDEKRV